MAHDLGGTDRLIRPRSDRKRRMFRFHVDWDFHRSRSHDLAELNWKDQSKSWAIWTGVSSTLNAQWFGACLATLYCLVGGTLATSSSHSACWQRYCCRQSSFLLCHDVPRRIQFASTQFTTQHLQKLPAVSSGLTCSLEPQNESIVRRNVYHVLEDTFRPTSRAFSRSVCSTHLVEVIHSSFRTVVGENDVRFAGALIHVRLRVFTGQKNDGFIFLGCVRHEGCMFIEPKHGWTSDSRYLCKFSGQLTSVLSHGSYKT